MSRKLLVKLKNDINIRYNTKMILNDINDINNQHQ